jgi:protein-glutamine gamma-glutamyltransferase
MTQGASVSSRQRIDRYFEVSLYLLVVAGFSILITTGQLDSPSVLIVSIALAVRGYLLAKERTLTIPVRWTTRLTILYALFYAVDYFMLSRSFVAATVHLVLYSMVVKIFSVHRERDYVYLGVLAFLEVLAASVLTVDTLFLGAFVLFTVLAATTFAALEMKRGAGRAEVQARETEVSRRLGMRLTAVVVTLVVAILLSGSLLFVILPRWSVGYMSTLAPRDQLRSGFSDSVRLGQIGQIELMNTVVMHVQFVGDKPKTDDMRWRGVALSIFDGHVWSNPRHDISLMPAGRYGTAEFPVARLYAPWELGGGGARPLHYHVVLEPVDTNLFFVAPRALELRGNYSEIGVDDSGSVYNNDRERPITRYEVISSVPARVASRLRTAQGPIPPKVALRYLQLPALDPRIPELTEQIVAGAGNDYDKAAAIEKYLSTNYRYTLKQSTRPPEDPLAEFLFERKQGHCEYFASSMAVMLRLAGIPSRVVNGFRGGELNDLTGSYIVRGRDAHSWVEAFFPGSGWVMFDPTPASSLPAPDLNRFALYMDAMREFWREWIINYDFFHQHALGVTAIARTRRGVESARDWSRRKYDQLLDRARSTGRTVGKKPGRWAGLAAAIAVLLLLGANARQLRQMLCKLQALRHPERAPQTAASVWYRRMTRTVAERGWEKRESQTPSEFVQSIGNVLLQDKVKRFTDHYERARFGESAEDAQKLPHAYEEICEK